MLSTISFIPRDRPRLTGNYWGTLPGWPQPATQKPADDDSDVIAEDGLSPAATTIIHRAQLGSLSMASMVPVAREPTPCSARVG